MGLTLGELQSFESLRRKSRTLGCSLKCMNSKSNVAHGVAFPPLADTIGYDFFIHYCIFTISYRLRWNAVRSDV